MPKMTAAKLLLLRYKDLLFFAGWLLLPAYYFTLTFGTTDMPGTIL